MNLLALIITDEIVRNAIFCLNGHCLSNLKLEVERVHKLAFFTRLSGLINHEGELFELAPVVKGKDEHFSF